MDSVTPRQTERTAPSKLLSSGTLQQLDPRGVNVISIRWGPPIFSKKIRERFQIQYACSNIMAAGANCSGRMRIDISQYMAEQAAKVP